MDYIAAKSLHHNVALRTRWIAHDACLTRSPDRAAWTLSVSGGLEPPQRRVGSALMLEVIGLGWPGVQFRFRFPLPQDDAELRRRTDRHLRDYRVPYRLAMRALVPDERLEAFEREALDPRAAAEEVGVPLSDLAWRVDDWRARAAVRAAVRPTDIEEYLARGALKPASQLTPTDRGARPRPSRRPSTRNRHLEARFAVLAAEARGAYEP